MKTECLDIERSENNNRLRFLHTLKKKQQAKIFMATMNMDEKRKIDKLIVADIDAAVQAYAEKRSEEREQLEKKLCAGVVVKAAIEARKQGEKMQEEAKARLKTLGIEIGYEGSVNFNNYGTTPNKEIVAFEQETDAGKKKIAGLKKTFALLLFAGNAEAEKLFERLVQELKKLGV